MNLRTRILSLSAALVLSAAALCAQKPAASATWTFAVSGDSRNCGDFVMPAIAAKVKAEHDAFYWHLGDFRAMHEPDQDLVSMLPAGTKLSNDEYWRTAWDDFLTHQVAAFAPTPVYLGRGNHETGGGKTREDYIAKFQPFLTLPDIEAARKADGAPLAPWFHFVRDGVDFITLDNASHDEFSDAQMHWLRGVLDRDLAPGSGIRTIIAGMHEALPHSTGSEHAMDDWELGIRTGERVFTWLYDAQAAGKHVYVLASHSHYYSPNVFNSPYWRQSLPRVLPGSIIGLSGAHRNALPRGAEKTARQMTYGFLEGTVSPDGSVAFDLKELSEADLVASKWPNAPLDAIHECVIHNGDGQDGK